MADTGAPFNLPYPEPGVAADVPYWSQQLADAVADHLAAQQKDEAAFHVYRAAPFNLGASGDTDLAFDTTPLAPSVGSHTGTVWTCGKTGYYNMHALVTFTTNNTFQVNGLNLMKSTVTGGSTYALLRGGDYKITSVSGGNYPLTLQLSGRILCTSGFNYKIAHNQQFAANGCALIVGSVYSAWTVGFAAEIP